MDPTRPLSFENPKFTTGEYSSLSGIELNTLSQGFLYVLDLNKNIIGKFSNIRQAHIDLSARGGRVNCLRILDTFPEQLIRKKL